MEVARREVGCFLTENPEISRDDAVVVDVKMKLEELLVNIAEGDGAPGLRRQPNANKCASSTWAIDLCNGLPFS